MKTLLAVSAGMALFLSSSAFADDTSEATTLSDFTLMSTGEDEAVAVTDTTVPPILMSFLSISQAQSGLPCFHCAPSPPKSVSLGLTTPTPYFRTSYSSIQFTILFQDVSFAGTCTASVVLKQGSKVLASGSAKGTLKPAVWYVFFSGPRSSKWHGAATATGTVACGGKSTSVSAGVDFQ